MHHCYKIQLALKIPTFYNLSPPLIFFLSPSTRVLIYKAKVNKYFLICNLSPPPKISLHQYLELFVEIAETAEIAETGEISSNIKCLYFNFFFYKLHNYFFKLEL